MTVKWDFDLGNFKLPLTTYNYKTIFLAIELEINYNQNQKRSTMNSVIYNPDNSHS